MILLPYNTNIFRGGQFRRTGMAGGNIIVGCVLGVLSGKYIFEEPLQHYWAEKRAEEALSATKEGSSTPAAATTAKPVEAPKGK